MVRDNEWFTEWFNSPFYHILYKHRDENEAQTFINRLESFLNFSKGMKVLDLGCGRGRHAVYLCQKGLNVTGIDIAQENIRYAKKFSSDTLNFRVHDMRDELWDGGYDVILNLFTSFGYFLSEEEDLKVLNNVYSALKTGGKFVIDFMNVDKIVGRLVTKQTITVEGIEFNITRTFIDGFIIKDINFVVNEKEYHFQEKVKAITHQKFLEYFSTTGFKVLNVFGNYQLDEFAQESERMIYVVEK
ncbi:MAG: SAM-dependent methyltransferase [Cytophagaceae bacterium]